MNSLSSLILTTKATTIPFPGLEGFSVSISAVSRDLSKKLREESETTKMDPRLKMPIKELNEDLFVENFVKAAVKGWTGLKYKYLQDLLLVDLSSVEDLEAEVEFNLENAVQLVKNSQIFDAWLNEAVFNLANFRK